MGGNSKFIKFWKEENVDTSLPINKKYLTKACEFYRINLKRKFKAKFNKKILWEPWWNCWKYGK